VPKSTPRKTETNRNRNRKVAGTELATLLVEQVPRDLIRQAKEKARSEGVSLKYKIVDMLRGYVAVNNR
jgi:hypothetical protein